MATPKDLQEAHKALVEALGYCVLRDCEACKHRIRFSIEAVERLIDDPAPRLRNIGGFLKLEKGGNHDIRPA